MVYSVPAFVSDFATQILTGALAPALLAGVYALSPTIRFYIRWCLIRTYIKGSKDPVFLILVAGLQHDEEKRNKKIKSVVDDFKFSKSLLTLTFPGTLEIGDGVVREEQAKAEARGRAWLARYRADVLIWGQVELGDRKVKLGFITPRSAVAPREYPLSERLKTQFREPAGHALHLAALEALDPSAGRDANAPLSSYADQLPALTNRVERKRLLLSTAIEKTGRWLLSGPEDFPEQDLWTVRYALAAAELSLGWEIGDVVRVDNAARLVSRLLHSNPANIVSKDRLSELHLLAGRALLIAHALHSGPFSARPPSLELRFPLRLAADHWKGTENREMWAEAEHWYAISLGADAGEEAARSFRAVLRHRRQARGSSYHVASLRALGQMFVTVGLQTVSRRRYHQAIAWFRTALAYRDRERHGSSIVESKLGLALALHLLGELDGDISALDGSISLTNGIAELPPEVLGNRLSIEALLLNAIAQREYGHVLFHGYKHRRQHGAPVGTIGLDQFQKARSMLSRAKKILTHSNLPEYLLYSRLELAATIDMIAALYCYESLAIESVSILRDILAERPNEPVAKHRLASGLTTQGFLNKRPAPVIEALHIFRELRDDAVLAGENGMRRYNEGLAWAVLAQMQEDDLASLKEAVACFAEAVAEFGRQQSRLRLETAKIGLESMQQRIALRELERSPNYSFERTLAEPFVESSSELVRPGERPQDIEGGEDQGRA